MGKEIDKYTGKLNGNQQEETLREINEQDEVEDEQDNYEIDEE